MPKQITLQLSEQEAQHLADLLAVMSYDVVSGLVAPADPNTIFHIWNTSDDLYRSLLDHGVAGKEVTNAKAC